jgi:perosamine synthetase
MAMEKIMKNSIPVYKPDINFLEKRNVNQCLKSSWISSTGLFIKKFEDSFKNFTNIKYCTTVSNGTVALHLAMLALEISSDDEVIVPTFTYIASVNCISYVGAKPVFVDSCIDTLQVDINDLKKKINKKTKAIIIPHLYGNITNMDKILSLKKKYNIFLIEDCAEAVGTFYNNNHAGTFGDISTFSFFGSKTITTGEGGMVCSNNKNLIDKVIKFKGQGLSVKKNKKYYWHDVIGYNYRMTNICAAIGCAQIKKINKILLKKKKIFQLYNKYLFDQPVSFIKSEKNSINSYWLVVILLKNYKKKKNLIDFLKQKNIDTRNTFYPIHSMPMYKRFQKKSNFVNAELISKSGVCLPSYSTLKKTDIIKISDQIKIFFRNEK